MRPATAEGGAPEPLLFWDFENAMSDRAVSTAVGIPSEPGLVSGFVSQTGGGPAEVWGVDVGTVFLTRHLGTNDVFLWVTVTRPVLWHGLTFRHWHNHNPGFPTCPGYRVQLQIDAGDGYENVGRPLALSDANSGGTDTVAAGRRLEPGSYKIRWLPKGLKRGKDTNSEFFAIKGLRLEGAVVEAERDAAPAPPAADSPGWITLTLAGVTLERMKVMESQYGGKCARSKERFEAGAVIAFKHREQLTDGQKAALFGAGRVTHVTVVLTPDEAARAGAAVAPAAEGGPPVSCQPDDARLAALRPALAARNRRDEWSDGVLSGRAVAYSCGALTRRDQPLDHRHDPAEWALCRRLAREAADRLRRVRLNDEAEGAPFSPYFVAAPVGAPAPEAVTEPLVRAAFGQTIHPDVPVLVEPMREGGYFWQNAVGCHHDEEGEGEYATAAETLRAFVAWLTGQPGARGHAFVSIGTGDDEPGVTKVRLAVALTAAGSLVGASSYIVFA